MNIHEYQAKALFSEYAIPVSAGAIAQNKQALDSALNKLPDGGIVVKAQIHAGGRGKGTFTDGYKGGVKLVTDKTAAKATAEAMLDNTLITHQTGPAGRKVQTIYFTQPCSIEKEYYLAILLDRAKGCPVIIASTEGGVEIEEVAKKMPEKIIRISIDPSLGLQEYQKRCISFGLGFKGEKVKKMKQLLTGLYRLFCEKDADLVEINPLITTKEGDLIALDAKVSFDTNALYRHPEIVALRDLNEEDPKEIEAGEFGLSYIALEGNIACLVNGAGLAMATMDIIKHYGGAPANFLDIGGGADEEQVTAAFKIILSDPMVKGILVNIFGGIMQCDIIAKGIINAAEKIAVKVPLVIRLEGTNVEAGKKLLAESGLPLTPADSLSSAAQTIVKQVQQ